VGFSPKEVGTAPFTRLFGFKSQAVQQQHPSDPLHRIKLPSGHPSETSK
jgi:hypothetical protein